MEPPFVKHPQWLETLLCYFDDIELFTGIEGLLEEGSVPLHPNAAAKRVEELMVQMFHSMRPQVSEESPLMEVTIPQLKTLFLLVERKPLRMSEISAHLGVGMPTVTSLVGKLEEKGLALREHDTQDRRVVLCAATPQGEAEVERFWQVRREWIVQMAKSLSDEDLELVARALELMVLGAQRRRRDA